MKYNLYLQFYVKLIATLYFVNFDNLERLIEVIWITQYKNVMSVIWDTQFHIDDDKESLSSMHVVYSFRQQLSTYIPISFLCSKSYFAVTGITSIFLFPASGGFILYVMFAAAFVHILCFVSFVSYFPFVK